MKLSEDHSKLPHPPLRRMSPLERHDLLRVDALPRSLLPPESRHLTRSPIRVISSGNKLLFTPKERSPLLPPSALQLGSAHSPSANVASILAKRSEPVPPSNFCPTPPPFMKDLSNQPLTSHIKKKPITKSRVFNLGSGTASSPRLELDKVQSSDKSRSVNPVRHHCQPLASSLSTKSAHEVCRPFRCNPDITTDDLRGCQPSLKSPVTHSPAALSRDMQHKHPTTTENKNDAGDIISKKRKQETDGDKPNKKSCVQHHCSTSSLTLPSLPKSSAIHTMSPKTPKNLLSSEKLPGKITHLGSPSVSESSQTTCKTRPPMGAKQVFMKTSVDRTVKIAESFQQDRHPACSENKSEAAHRTTKSLSLPSAGAPGDAGRSGHLQSSIPTSAQKHSHCSGLIAKTLGKNTQMDERPKSGSNHKPTTPSFSSKCSRSSEINKSTRKRRHVAVPGSDDISNLFAPDPTTFLVVDGQRFVKSTVFPETSKPTVADKMSPSVHSTSTAGAPCHKATNVTQAAGIKGSYTSSDLRAPILLPTICLQRLKIHSKSLHLTSSKVKNNSKVAPSRKTLQYSGLNSDRKQTPHGPGNCRPCTVDTEQLPSQKKPSSSQSTTSYETRTNKKKPKRVTEQVASDVELDLDLSFSLDLDLSQSSRSSEPVEEEEEQLLSLQELMKPSADTPGTGATAELSTPGHRSSKTQAELPKESKLQPSTKPRVYKHNLDVMIKEKNTDNRYYKIKNQLLDSRQDCILTIAEYEKAEETREEDISNEHQEFLQHYTLTPTAMKEVPPGEVVFNLEKFGCIFDRDTLQLKKCIEISQGVVQKMLLTSCRTQLNLHLMIGMFKEVYDSDPCPAEVTQFLFKMMSVHDERTVSQKILQTLYHIACTAAYHIVQNGDQQFKVWIPSLADVALVLINMGAAFVSLFPLENLQPPFTEGDLLADASLKTESQRKTEQRSFPEANYSNILKYLRLCMTLCPWAYSDDELLLLLTVLGKASLDTSLVLHTGMELDTLLGKIFHNIKEWDAMMPKICHALVDLTEDHHNMCLLVKLLPRDKCGTQLRRQLCLSMISKLLDGRCTYTPTDDMLTLSKLRLYLPRMQPTSILQTILSTASRDDQSTLDEQAYYVCYSLLTLVKEASNFQTCPPQQKEELLCLCSELETHVKCHIRESEKCLYRTRVKDLVARIDIKWQILLHGTKPLDNQIYHYWKPLPGDVLQEELDSVCSNSEGIGGEQEMSSAGDNEAAVLSEEEETEEIRSKVDAGSKTEAGLNQDGPLVGENLTDDLHEDEMTGVECGVNVETPVIPRKLEEKQEER